MTSTKVEFLVKMTCNSCVKDIENSLKDVKGIKNVDINLANGSVVIESILPILDLQKKLEATGKQVAIKGYDGTAAVSILEVGEKNVQGVVRFVQASPDTCIIDGTIDGLKPGKHNISIHECGDISKGCTSVGKVFNPENNMKKRIYGNIGIITAERNGRAEFRLEDNIVKLSECIGRSFVINMQDQKGTPVACGIIARSAGLFQNPKTVCACDGTTIWDEVSKPNSKSSL